MESFLPLVSYAFVTSITPGPNNIMLTASGISFGLKKTVPHILGIPFGFGVQLALCAYGLGAILLHVPEAQLGLKAFGTGYLLYLVWCLRVNVVSSNNSGQTDSKPLTFIEAALFQFANPKAWIMALTGASIFIPSYQPFALSVAMLCVIFCFINLPCVGIWAVLGTMIKQYLKNEVWQKIFSGVIVLLTIYSAIAIWL